MSSNDDASQKDKFVEIGATGLNAVGGRIYEEPLTKLSGDRWNTVLRDMRENDAVINSILFTIEMLARQVSWNFEPFSEDREDLENNDFIRNALFNDMEATWQDNLSEFLTFLAHGWSYFEIVFKRRSGMNLDPSKHSHYSDGLIGWRKFAIRAQESLYEWDFEDSGDIRAMKQMPPPDYKIYTIPYAKSLHFRTTAHKNNPQGRSILRGAYRSWYFKTNLENIEGIGIERDLAGLPVLGVPPELLAPDATAQQKQLAQALYKMVTSIRRDEMEGVLMPLEYDKDGNPRYELKLLSTGGQRQFDTSKIIDRYDQRILMSTLTDFLMLGSHASGSFALSTDKTELFSAAIGAFLDVICDVINRRAVPQLLRLNGKDQTRPPRLVHGEIERLTLREIGQFIKDISNTGITFDTDEITQLKRKILR